jgi:hypothetical protein
MPGVDLVAVVGTLAVTVWLTLLHGIARKAWRYSSISTAATRQVLPAAGCWRRQYRPTASSASISISRRSICVTATRPAPGQSCFAYAGVKRRLGSRLDVQRPCQRVPSSGCPS